MLNKIFGNKILNTLSLNKISSRATENPSGPGEKRSRALKIIHLGGMAEYYYMAVPAARIIDKYPKFILARPEIFRRPWDSIVRPEEILVPGQRYYVVPRQTVKKLRRRIKRSSPMKDSFCNSVSQSSIMVKSGTKVKGQNRHVTFLGIENNGEESCSGGSIVRNDGKKGSKYMKEKGTKEKLGSVEMRERRRRDGIENSWEPSLNAIDENINEY